MGLLGAWLLAVLPTRAEEPFSTAKEPSHGGTGEVYMDREISQTVSSHAISRLERRDREGRSAPLS